MIDKASKHTLGQTLLLHLFPGVITCIVIFLCVPTVIKYGFPNNMASEISVLLSLIPVQLGVLLIIAKKRTGTFNIFKLFPYIKKSGLKEYLIFIPIMAAWAILVSTLLTPVEHNFRDTVFTFIPQEYMIGNYDIGLFDRDKIVILSLVSLITNGFFAPIVEEFYFRGYLLPRINLSPNKAVVASAVLFSLYHFFSPWYFFSRVLMMIPLYYWVVKKKNIRFSIISHIIANSITSLSMLLSLS